MIAYRKFWWEDGRQYVQRIKFQSIMQDRKLPCYGSHLKWKGKYILKSYTTLYLNQINNSNNSSFFQLNYKIGGREEEHNKRIC